jgi:multidrug efflux pump subunit AcrA (membrane-fusion protein)
MRRDVGDLVSRFERDARLLLRQVPSAPPIRSYTRKGVLLAVLFFGVGGTWAALAPLTSATMAPGVVKVDSYRKTIQHLEGGVIREILVREGEVVRQGQLLVRLDDADARADLNMLQGQTDALEAEGLAMKEQLPSIEEQLKDQQTLYDKGYTTKTQMYELKRSAAKLKGDISANESRLFTLHEEESKAKAKILRRQVTALQDGVVMNLRVHTIGGVVQPGGDILDLVPTRDKLIVELKVSPMDIDVVRAGMDASVRFVAYKRWSTPTVQGRVTSLSADAISDQRTGNTYFSATVEVAADELAKVRQVKLYPGMPVEAAIITGKRTMLTFLLQPFTDSFAHAFLEE